MKSSHSFQQGLGLIEVLVSLLILAVTVLGFAGLQMRAVKASGDAQYMVQATAIVEDLRERMANNAINGNPTPMDDSALAYYRNAANWNNARIAVPPVACVNAACNQLQMAAFDVAQITYGAQTLLPDGMVRAEPCQNPATQTCIYVSWGGTQPTAGAAGQCVDGAGRRVVDANCVVGPQ